MRVRGTTIVLQTSAGTDVVDITERVALAVQASEVAEGIAVVFVPGSTAGVTTIENESGVLHDLRRAIDRMAPEGDEYEHNEAWGDMNGYSHVRAALLGPSVAVPIRNAKLTLGRWQQIVLCDFDNRPRDREVLIEIVGD